MKIFLDDIRNPSDCSKYMHARIGKLNPIYLEGGWYIVRDYDQFIWAIESYHSLITHISFDHDLAPEHYAFETEVYKYKEKTGYDCAVFLKKFYDQYNLPYPVMFCHSMNPVGTERIISVFATKKGR